MTAVSAPPSDVHRVTSMKVGMGGNLVSPATGSIRLVGLHFTASAFYLIAGAAGLLWIAPELADGLFLSPRVAGVTHLFTLGWITTTIFGALYQLLPVALGAPLRWRAVGYLSFWTFAPGAGLFACGVAEMSTLLHHAGIALVAIGVLLAVVNVGATLSRARSRDVTWAAMALALAFLTSTLVLGVVLLHNLHTGFLAALRVRVLATHLHVAVIGWAVVMMVGVSHRLLPMFLLAHGADRRWTQRALVLLAAGLVVLAPALTSGWSLAAWTGLVLLEAGFACFMWQAFAFYRTRVRKRLDIGMQIAAAGLAFLVLAAMLAPVVLATGISAPRVGTAYVAALLGGVVTYIVGFLYKIIPLLTWTVRFHGRAGSAGAPTVAQLYSAGAARAQLAFMVAGLAVLVAAILAGVSAAAYLGAALFACAVALFAGQLLRIVFGTPTPQSS